MKRLIILGGCILLVVVGLHYAWKAERGMRDTVREARRATFESEQCIFRVRNFHPDPLFQLLESEREGGRGVVYASNINPFSFYPVAIVSSTYIINDLPLLWQSDTNKKRVIVVKDFFSDIIRGDAIRIQYQDGPQYIGKFFDPNFSSIAPRRLIRFLLDTHLIQTFHDLSADVCLLKEEDTAEWYRTFFLGIHSYCTNECIEELYRFQVTINKQTGEINLEKF